MIFRILIIAAVVLFLVLWVRAVIDAFRRADLSIGGKIAWAIGMLVVPFIGLLVYTMLRPSDSQIAKRRRTLIDGPAARRYAGTLDRLRMLPSGSLNQTVRKSPMTWTSPSRVVSGRS